MNTHEVAEITGATLRQLHYWCSLGLIEGQPVKPGSGPRGYRHWTEAQVERVELLILASIVRHLDLGDLADWLDTVTVGVGGGDPNSDADHIWRNR